MTGYVILFVCLFNSQASLKGSNAYEDVFIQRSSAALVLNIKILEFYRRLEQIIYFSSFGTFHFGVSEP